MRYYIVGASGSGKSTLARAIAARLRLPHIELDHLQFLPRGQTRSPEDFIQEVDRATQTQGWVVCGNYRAVKGMLMERADMIIWLDYPFWLTFWRVWRRTMRRMWHHKPCCNGNFESLWRQFCTKDSIFLWVLTTYWKRKRNYTTMMRSGTYAAKWVRLAHPQAAAVFLESLNHDDLTC